MREPRDEGRVPYIARSRRLRFTPPGARYVRGKLVFRNFYESPEKRNCKVPFLIGGYFCS